MILEPQLWKSYKNNRNVSEVRAVKSGIIDGSTIEDSPSFLWSICQVAKRHFQSVLLRPENFPDLLLNEVSCGEREGY